MMKKIIISAEQNIMKLTGFFFLKLQTLFIFGVFMINSRVTTVRDTPLSLRLLSGKVTDKCSSDSSLSDTVKIDYFSHPG